MFSRLTRKTDDVLIRPLTRDDWPDLEAMIAQDPVAFLYAVEQLDRLGLPNSSSLSAYRQPYGFMGVFEPLDAVSAPLEAEEQPASHEILNSVRHRVANVVEQAKTAVLGQKLAPGTAIPGTPEELKPVAPGGGAPSYRLAGVFWMGSNCVPLTIKHEHLRAVSASIFRASKHIASIFGNQTEVLALWELLKTRMTLPLSVRDNQPLLELAPQVNLGRHLRTPLTGNYQVPQIEENVRWARTSDRDTLLKASIAMFTEEIGYDPMTRDPRGYAQRVDEYIRTGRTLVATNTDGIVIFKVDVGLAHADTCQLQGVWLHPAYRGHGLSEPLLAQACELVRPRFPRISLYVNDYNVKALALYRAVGFEQVGTFASILF